MENNEKNTGKSNIINADFRTETKIQSKKPANTPVTQTNPILRRLFKLTHEGLTNSKNDYKSFSSFKPEDLR